MRSLPGPIPSSLPIPGKRRPILRRGQCRLSGTATRIAQTGSSALPIGHWRHFRREPRWRSERHGKAGITQEQRGRMHCHRPMFEQRIHPQNTTRGSELHRGIVEILLVGSREGHIVLAEQQNSDEQYQNECHHHKRNAIQALGVSRFFPGNQQSKYTD